MYILHINFCAISFNRSRDIIIPKILENLRLQCPHQAILSKIISILLLKISILHAKFCTIHAIKPEIELSHEMWKKQKNSAPYWDISTQISSWLFLVIYIMYIIFCVNSFTTNRDQRIRKNFVKMTLQRHLLSDFHQKLMDTNLRLDNTKYKKKLH